MDGSEVASRLPLLVATPLTLLLLSVKYNACRKRMPPPQPSLDELPHGAFDEHFLRCFAHELPFHIRPARHETPYAARQFIDHFCGCLENALNGNGNKELMIALRTRELLRQHVAFTCLERLVRLHAGQETLDGAVAWVRHDLRRIGSNGLISIPSPYHPLYGNCRSRHTLSASDIPLRVMDATVPDKKIANALAIFPFQETLPAAAERYTSLDTQCRIVRYSVQLLEQIRAILSHEIELTNSTRDIVVHNIIEEWLTIRSGQLGKTADMRRNAHILGQIVNALQKEVAIKEVSKDDPETVIACLMPALEKNQESFLKFLPLLEQFIIDLAQSKDEGNLRKFIVDIQLLIQKNRAPLCDHPGLGLALLAIRARFFDRKEILFGL